jgi:UDP-N-acetylmuramoyl-L-alanyl-D-glutamate--2,6-diaminopimelate ligase
VILRELVHVMDAPDVSGSMELEIGGLAYDSRRVRDRDLFFGLTGLRQDGQAFARRALDSGAAAVVVGRDVSVPEATFVRVDEPRKALAQAAGHFFGEPSRTMTVVGVTGTNGKTTTTYLLEAIFAAAGRRAGVIGTTGVRMAGESRPSAFTTPEAPELQQLLSEMAGRDVDAVALELSSHALVQRRCYGLACDVAIFTNLSHDHLDYHGTLEEYLDAKLMLFDGRNGPRAKSTMAVINADDPVAPRVVAAAERGGMRIERFSADEDYKDTDELAVHVEGITPSSEGLSLQMIERSDGILLAGRRERRVRLPLLGRFNAWNAAAAFTAARALGISTDTIVAGLESCAGVPGRLERVDAGQPFQVLVDYAHTPDALSRALAAVREHARGRVLVVFGCGGDRDRAKRPVMGRVAREQADEVWVTSDNPRSEAPEAITREIVAGAGPDAHVVLDRREAIADALRAAREGDAVLIAGKGHETTQTIGDRVLLFDDRLTARELLLERGRA